MRRYDDQRQFAIGNNASTTARMARWSQFTLQNRNTRLFVLRMRCSGHNDLIAVGRNRIDDLTEGRTSFSLCRCASIVFITRYILNDVVEFVAVTRKEHRYGDLL